MDLPDVADTLMLDIDDLFPLTELLEILHFAKVSKGDITITEEGKAFVEADILERKKIFSNAFKKICSTCAIYLRSIDSPSAPSCVGRKFPVIARRLSNRK